METPKTSLQWDQLKEFARKKNIAYKIRFDIPYFSQEGFQKLKEYTSKSDMFDTLWWGLFFLVLMSSFFAWVEASGRVAAALLGENPSFLPNIVVHLLVFVILCPISYLLFVGLETAGLKILRVKNQPFNSTFLKIIELAYFAHERKDIGDGSLFYVTDPVYEFISADMRHYEIQYQPNPNILDVGDKMTFSFPARYVLAANYEYSDLDFSLEFRRKRFEVRGYGDKAHDLEEKLSKLEVNDLLHSLGVSIKLHRTYNPVAFRVWEYARPDVENPSLFGYKTKAYEHPVTEFVMLVKPEAMDTPKISEEIMNAFIDISDLLYQEIGDKKS